MRLPSLLVVAALTGCSLLLPAKGEGEGDVVGGEGEGGVGEGEGDVVGEGEGDIGEGEGDVGEGEGDVVVGEGEGDAFCGDTVTSEREECDDGGAVNGDGCDVNCTVTRCGNGIIAGAEQCDDGGLDDGDGCSASCLVEFCGDGVVNNAGSEACDSDDAGCVACGLAVDVDNLVGAEAVVGVPVRVVLPPLPAGQQWAAFGPDGTTLDVEIVGDSGWFRPDLVPHSVARWILRPQPTTSAIFPDFSLHEHCTDVADPSGPAGAVCVGRAALGESALVVGDNALFVHAAWPGNTRQRSESVLHRSGGDVGATVNLEAGIDGAPILTVGAVERLRGPQLDDGVWHDVSVAIDALVPVIFVDGSVMAVPPGGASSFAPSAVVATATERGGRDVIDFSGVYDELFFSASPRKAAWIQAFARGLRGYVASTPVIDQDLGAGAGWESFVVAGRGAVTSIDDAGLTLTASTTENGEQNQGGVRLPLPPILEGTRLRASFLVDFGGEVVDGGNGFGVGLAGDNFADGSLFMGGGASAFVQSLSVDGATALSASKEPLTGLVGFTLVVDHDGWWAQNSSLAGWREGDGGDGAPGPGLTSSAWASRLDDTSSLTTAPYLRFSVVRLSTPGTFAATLRRVVWTIEPIQ